MMRRTMIGITIMLGLGVIGITLFIFTPAVGNGKLWGMAIVPEAAVRDMLQVSANRLQNFRVLRDESWGMRRILLYSYTVQPAGQPPRNEFGYALTEMRAGWSAIPGRIYADAPFAAQVTYASAQLDDTTIVYGKTLDPLVTTIEASFDNGLTRRAMPVNTGFLLRARGNITLQTVMLFDAPGNILQQHNAPNLHERPHW